MVKIVPIVGYAKTYELVYDRFLEMCRCKEHFVRRECATAFPVMCEVLGNELFEKSMVSDRSNLRRQLNARLLIPSKHFSTTDSYPCS